MPRRYMNVMLKTKNVLFFELLSATIAVNN